MEEYDKSYSININEIFEKKGSIHVDEEVSKYTDDHFFNKLNEELEKIRVSENLRITKNSMCLDNVNNNSPIIMSNNNSDDDDDGLNFDEGFIEDYFSLQEREQLANISAAVSNNQLNMNYNQNKKPSFKKLSFRDVQNSIQKYYQTEDKYSNELDILTTFLKGQKNLYMKSNMITKTKLNLLMVPSLIGTSIITIFAPIIQNYSWSGAFISGLNAMVVFFISIIHYFKLESSSNMYAHLAIQYDKLESSLEFTNNKLIFIDNLHEKTELVLTKMKEIEKKINDIKETTNVCIPYQIKTMFPIICNVNIFSFIKRIEVYNKNLVIKFKDIKNEILYIQWKWNGGELEPKQKSRLEFLYKIKEKIKDEILHYKNAYGCIDELIIKEINRADKISLWNVWFGHKRTIETSDNPVLKEYLETIFS